MLSYLPYILVMSIVTYLIRMLPFTFFKKEIKNQFLKSFLFYVPYAVLGAMTFPAIFTSAGTSNVRIISCCIGCAFAFLLAYHEKSLLTVSIVACAVVYIVTLLL